MKVAVIPIVIGVQSTITKGMIKRLEDWCKKGRVETMQTSALLRSARILRRVLETCGDLLSLRLRCKIISANVCMKNYRMSKIVIIVIIISEVGDLRGG